MSVLLPYTYLGPIHYFSAIVQEKRVVLECHEHFPKQTYRNRCTIYGANGPLNLVVPTIHISGERSIALRRIAYDQAWQKLHWKSLETAYRSSPYFEYYEDDLYAILMKKHDFLVDLNRELLNLILGIIDIQAELSETASYEDEFDGIDLRGAWSPKAGTSEMEDFKRYPQVFEDRHGFIPNLSIADLIFNQGPNSKDYL